MPEIRFCQTIKRLVLRWIFFLSGEGRLYSSRSCRTPNHINLNNCECKICETLLHTAGFRCLNSISIYIFIYTFIYFCLSSFFSRVFLVINRTGLRWNGCSLNSCQNVLCFCAENYENASSKHNTHTHTQHQNERCMQRKKKCLPLLFFRAHWRTTYIFCTKNVVRLQTPQFSLINFTK